MADQDIFGVSESGTYATSAPNPHVDLSGGLPGVFSIEQVVSGAMSNAQTGTFTIRKNSANWAIYSGATYTTGTPNILDLSGASLVESLGSLANGDTVYCEGLSPTDYLRSADIGSSVAAFAATASQAEMEAGTETEVRAVTPERIAQAIAALGGSGSLENVVEDTSPQLGGSLDVNGQSIVSVSAGNITIVPDTTGVIVLGNTAGAPLKSSVSDGATAVAFTLDTSNALSTSGAKLVEIKNNGTTVLSLSKNANTLTLNSNQIIYSAHSAGYPGSLFFGPGGGSLSNTTGTEGYYNASFGFGSLSAITTGERNTAIGYNVLTAATTGGSNVAIGAFCLTSLTTNSKVVAIGAGSANSYTGKQTVVIGADAMNSATGANYNTAIGYGVLQSATSGNNTAIGRFAGKIVTGGNNTFIGYQAGDALTTAAGCIVIGYDVDAPSATTDYQLCIGNLVNGIWSGTQKISFFSGTTPAVQQSHVADPAGGGTVDAEARTAINSILTTLETFGFHATS